MNKTWYIWLCQQVFLFLLYLQIYIYLLIRNDQELSYFESCFTVRSWIDVRTMMSYLSRTAKSMFLTIFGSKIELVTLLSRKIDVSEDFWVKIIENDSFCAFFYIFQKIFSKHAKSDSLLNYHSSPHPRHHFSQPQFSAPNNSANFSYPSQWE